MGERVVSGWWCCVVFGGTPPNNGYVGGTPPNATRTHTHTEREVPSCLFFACHHQNKVRWVAVWFWMSCSANIYICCGCADHVLRHNRIVSQCSHPEAKRGGKSESGGGCVQEQSPGCHCGGQRRNKTAFPLRTITLIIIVVRISMVIIRNSRRPVCA